MGEGVESEKGRRRREREKGRAESNGEVLDILNFHLGHDHLGLFRPIDSGPSFRWETDDQLGTRREREKNGKFRWTLVERG